jgi:hypothetical protein
LPLDAAGTDVNEAVGTVKEAVADAEVEMGIEPDAS